VLPLDPPEFLGEPVQRLVPRQRDELVTAAHRVGAGAALEPAAPGHRLRDARAVPERRGGVLDDRIRIRISRMRPHDQLAIAPAGREHAPMRAVRLHDRT
jgi:hypothetical protein